MVRRAALALATVTVLAAPGAHPTRAQSPDCARMPVEVLVEGSRAADYIFEGTIARRDGDWTTFDVQAYHKNSSGPQLAVRMPEEGGWAGELPTGRSYMILAKRYGPILWLDPCLQAAAAAQPDALMTRLGLGPDARAR